MEPKKKQRIHPLFVGVGIVILFIIGLGIYSIFKTDKKAGRSRRHRKSRKDGLLPGGGLGTEYFPMRYSPNIYVGPPRGTGYEPYWYVPPPPPSYNDEQYYNPYSYPYIYPYFYNVRAPLRYPYYY